MNLDALALSCGLLCVLPLGMFAIGYFAGRKGARLQLPVRFEIAEPLAKPSPVRSPSAPPPIRRPTQPPFSDVPKSGGQS